MLEHPFFLGLQPAHVADIPGLEVGKLVLRRQERVRFSVSLDLRHLDDGLPPHAGLRIRAGEIPAAEGLLCEH